jgi:hypothetical protein
MAASTEHSFDISSPGEELVAFQKELLGGTAMDRWHKCEQVWVLAFVQTVMKHRVL